MNPAPRPCKNRFTEKSSPKAQHQMGSMEERRSRSAPSKCAIRTTLAVSSDKDEHEDMGTSSSIVVIRHIIFLIWVFPKIDLVVLLLSASEIGCSA